jgi:hypothetical protein
MTKEQEDQLHREVHLGGRANAAYEGYMKDYFARQRKLLFDQFIETKDIDTALTIRAAMDALSAVERSIISDIDSGRMASITLKKAKDNE